ncbi:MAG TPA: PAS domain S-box protein [Anaerolineae bacterium]|nr:PAS domain S-box protein [Anaerolineae bacterium]
MIILRIVKTLYPKIMALVGSVFGLTIIAIVAFVYASESRQIEREGLAQAEALNRMAFEALYASMRQGGDREDIRRVIARLREAGDFTTLRVVKGTPVIQQFGAAPDEWPQDALERQALTGQEVWQVQEEDGYPVVRYVTPLRVEAECQTCHEAAIGAVNGVISTEISLREFETTLRQRRNVLLLVLGGGLLLLGLLTFYALRRVVIQPLQAIQAGTAAIAQGDLDHRLVVCTGDELESLAQEFNRMARRLQDSYGRIAEERGRVLAAIEASRDAIWVSDANRRITMVNSALERLTGRRREDLLGQTCRYLLGARTCEGAYLCDVTCPFLAPESESGGIEGYIATATGQDAWVEVSYGRVTDPDGRLAGVVHIVHDLTERKEVEQLKDEFISMVSHELRTPLHHIKGFATTLLQTDVEWDAATQRDFLESINREADRLTDLVEKILHLSRLESRELPMEKGWYQVSDLVDGALQRRHSLIADRPVEIDLAPELPALFVDGEEIEVVLMNLIENAAKYSTPGAPITLTVHQQDEQVIFAITDQGIGIPPEHQERIFERFYRVEREGQRVAGTGLGLAICKRIVEAHGGRLWVESAPGVGSRFSFSLTVGPCPELSRSEK